MRIARTTVGFASAAKPEGCLAGHGMDPPGVFASLASAGVSYSVATRHDPYVSRSPDLAANGAAAAPER